MNITEQSLRILVHKAEDAIADEFHERGITFKMSDCQALAEAWELLGRNPPPLLRRLVDRMTTEHTPGPRKQREESPDLLDACKQLVREVRLPAPPPSYRCPNCQSEFSYLRPFVLDNTQEALARAQSAIAKAEGNQP